MASLPVWANWYVGQLGGGMLAERAVAESLDAHDESRASPARQLSVRQQRRQRFAAQGRAALAEAAIFAEASSRARQRRAEARQAEGLRQQLPEKPAEPSGLTAEQIAQMPGWAWAPTHATARTFDCAVCMAPFEAGDEVSGLPCSHAFHKLCISNWLERQPSCPLCRAPAIHEVASLARGGPAALDPRR